MRFVLEIIYAVLSASYGFWKLWKPSDNVPKVCWRWKIRVIAVLLFDFRHWFVVLFKIAVRKGIFAECLWIGTIVYQTGVLFLCLAQCAVVIIFSYKTCCRGDINPFFSRISISIKLKTENNSRCGFAFGFRVLQNAVKQSVKSVECWWSSRLKSRKLGKFLNWFSARNLFEAKNTTRFVSEIVCSVLSVKISEWPCVASEISSKNRFGCTSVWEYLLFCH